MAGGANCRCFSESESLLCVVPSNIFFAIRIWSRDALRFKLRLIPSGDAGEREISDGESGGRASLGLSASLRGPSGGTRRKINPNGTCIESCVE